MFESLLSSSDHDLRLVELHEMSNRSIYMCQRHDNGNNALLEADRFGGHDKRYVAEEEIWRKKKEDWLG